MFQRVCGGEEGGRIPQQATIIKNNLYMGFSIFIHYTFMNSLKQKAVRLVDRTSRVTNSKLKVANRKVLWSCTDLRGVQGNAIYIPQKFPWYPDWHMHLELLVFKYPSL